MSYMLKSESFMVVDGPYKGKKYEHGKEYFDIPPNEINKFVEMSPKATPPVKSKPQVSEAKKNVTSDDNQKPIVRSGANKED